MIELSIDIAVVGSINYDLTVVTPRHPRPGETVLGTTHYSGGGGKGANQAVAASRLGSRVALIGRVGDDDLGTELVAGLAVEGIDTSGIDVAAKAPTGIAVITVDEAAENTIVVSPGANMTLSPDQIEEHREVIAGAKVLLAQLEVPLGAITAAVDAARGLVCLNPAPAQKLPDQLLDRVDVLIPNRSELALLAGTGVPKTVEEAAGAAQRLSTKGIVVVTLGAEGALVVDGNGEVTHLEAPGIEAVDPTAAGDAFCGALAHSLSRGEPILDGARRAVVAGALAATRRGARDALPSPAEVESLLGA